MAKNKDDLIDSNMPRIKLKLPDNFNFSTQLDVSVCTLIPPFFLRNFAHQNTERHKSIVVESKA
jgi:hypothetical protein